MRSSRHINLKHLLIDNQKFIGLQFYQNKALEALTKQLPNAQWSKDYQMHYIENNPSNVNLIFKTFRGTAWINGKYFFTNKAVHKGIEEPKLESLMKRKTSPGVRRCPDSYIQKLKICRYAENTAKTYVCCFEKFINYYKEYDLLTIDEAMIRDYLQFLLSQGISDSYLNQAINSIKFYYELVEGMPNRFYSVDRPRKKQKLPSVLSKEEIKSMISNTPNIKHKCIVSILYSSGLRRSEVINLKLQDIDSRRMVVFVEGAKGDKDRLTLLSETVLKDLRLYFTRYKPVKYLFEGQKNGQYSATSVANIVKTAGIQAGIKKKTTPHMLRHSAVYPAMAGPPICSRRVSTSVIYNVCWVTAVQEPQKYIPM